MSPDTNVDLVSSESETPSTATEMFQPVTELTSSQENQKNLAMAARDALFTRLSGRLMDVIQKDGPAAAIEVCKADAPAFAEQVKQEFGVQIGRTSFKLRSSMNPVPEWAAAAVEQLADTDRFFDLPQNALGVLLPIRLQQKCTVCHGTTEQIPDAVSRTLKLHYPNDQATGFAEGDLRGWFWVEVPHDAAKHTPMPTNSDSSAASSNSDVQ